MYCRRLKNGKWSCTVDATPDPLTGKRRQVTRRGDTKKEASNRAQEAAGELSRERQQKKMLVLEVYNEWMTIYKEINKPSTARVRRIALSPFLDKHGEHFIGKLQLKDVQNFLIERRDSGISRNYLSGIRTSLKLLFDFAMKNKYIKENVVEDTVIPKVQTKPNETTPQKKFLENHEVQIFLSGLKTSNRRNAYQVALLMLSTGLRIGESLSLTWNDVGLDENKLTVNKTLYEDSENESGFEFTGPKSFDSHRVISFNENLAKELRSLKLQHNKEKLIGRYSSDSEFNDLVFKGRNAQPVRASTISDAFNQTYKTYGIEGVNGTHVLRHTHITMLVEAGVDLPVIMERVGHANINITLEIYAHITERMQDESDKKINEYFLQFI